MTMRITISLGAFALPTAVAVVVTAACCLPRVRGFTSSPTRNTHKSITTMTMIDREDGLFDANNNNMNVFIGIDVGTQGTKAIAYRPASSTLSGSKQTQGKILGCASASYSLLTTDITGRVEQDPNANDWINAVQFVLKTLVTDLGLVAAPSSLSTSKQQHYVLSGIGILGQQHGMVLLDSNYEPLRPANSGVMWKPRKKPIGSAPRPPLPLTALGSGITSCQVLPRLKSFGQ